MAFLKILALHASGQGVPRDYGTRYIDAAKIDEIFPDEHISARDEEGELVKIEGKIQYEPEAVRLIRYRNSGQTPIEYSVRGTAAEWLEIINAARIAGNAVPVPGPEENGEGN